MKEKQWKQNQAEMKATHLTVNPLNVAEYVVTCMNNWEQTWRNAEGTGKREEGDRGVSADRPEKGRIEGV
jgi:hypothetical protein